MILVSATTLIMLHGGAESYSSDTTCRITTCPRSKKMTQSHAILASARGKSFGLSVVARRQAAMSRTALCGARKHVARVRYLWTGASSHVCMPPINIFALNTGEPQLATSTAADFYLIEHIEVARAHTHLDNFPIGTELTDSGQQLWLYRPGGGQGKN